MLLGCRNFILSSSDANHRSHVLEHVLRSHHSFFLPGYERVLSWDRSCIPYHSALLGLWFSFLKVGYVSPVEGSICKDSQEQNHVKTKGNTYVFCCILVILGSNKCIVLTKHPASWICWFVWHVCFFDKKNREQKWPSFVFCKVHSGNLT